MRRGTFRKTSGGRTVVGDPNTVVLFGPGERFTVSHPRGDDNRGITIRVRGAWLEPMQTQNENRWPAGLNSPIASSKLLVPPKVHLLVCVLVADIARGVGVDTLEIEERTLAVIGQVLGGRAEGRGHDVTNDARAVRRVAEIVEFLSENHARRITLDEIGYAAGCSSWHAARLFRSVNGLSVHRYLKRLRLSYALNAIAEGCEDLTRLALDTGFSSHSHFTAAFRAEFGTPPSLVRDRCLTPSNGRHASCSRN
jgi:AraC-like DNA-binding protein